MSKFDELWAAFEQEVGPQLVDEMAVQSPVGDPTTDPESGTLAASHDWTDENGELQVVSADPRGPIALYNLRGTQPHEIEPVVANALHFFVDGNEVYTQHVDHPGTSANPYNQRAWEAQRDAVVQSFKDNVGKGLVLAYLNPYRKR